MMQDHRAVIADLDDAQRRDLVARSNGPGLRHLAGHVGAIVIFGALIAAEVPGWPLLLLPHGVLLVFLFPPLHECVHKTAFKSDWLSITMAEICGIIVGQPSRWFSRFHVTHHRFTNDPVRDPELAAEKGDRLWNYLVYMSGIRYWRGQARTLTRNAVGLNADSFINAGARGEIQFEAQRYLAVYAIAIASSIWAESFALVWLWWLPLLLGQPFLRGYLIAEHTGCPATENMLENSRTTYINALVRFLAWNMPYHIEHHAHPAVPFHKLPAFHALIRDHLAVTEQGYGRFHRKLWRKLTT